MTETRIHPAVFAGLLGGGAMGMPTLAFAAPLDGVAETIAGSLLLQFLVGCAAGAAVAGSIAYVAERLYMHRENDNAAGETDYTVVIDKNGWSYNSVNLVRGLSPDLDDDSIHTLDSYQVSEPIEFPEAAEPVEDDAYAEDDQAAESAPTTVIVRNARAVPVEMVRPRHLRMPRHFDAEVTLRLVIRDAGKRIGRHFSSVTESGEIPVSAAHATASQTRVGRHFAPTSEQEAVSMVASNADDASSEQSMIQNPVAAAGEMQLVPVGDGGVQVNLDYSGGALAVKELAHTSDASVEAELQHGADAPEGFSQKPGLLQRMSAGTRSVRKALAQRFGSISGSGNIPIIARGDGSASEEAPSRLSHVAAPVAESISSDLGGAADTAAVDDRQPSERAFSRLPEGPERSAYISRHVSEVDLGLYPERRSADELGRNDMWEEALMAMGEKLGQTTPVIFKDAIGGPSTIDEPEGMESVTRPAEFRAAVAEDKEVVTNTYVDYLLRDELSHSDVEVLRTSPHAHLRVIEGGTEARRIQRSGDETGDYVRTGRHYAPQGLAREA